MAAQNDFSLFAVGTGANVLGQSSWVVDPALATGFQAGIAPSAKFNKAWRQNSYGTAALAQFIVNQAGIAALDDGNLTNFVTNYQTALSNFITSSVTFQKYLSAPLTLYCGGSGASDTNNGLSSSAPFATLQKAVNTIRTYNANGNSITVQCTGAFSQGFTVLGPFPGAVGVSGVTFNFASGSSITEPVNNCILANAGASFTLTGSCTFSATATTPGNGAAIYIQGGSQVSLGTGGTFTFGTCGNVHISTISAGTIVINTGYQIGGSAPFHYSVINSGIYLATANQALTISLVGTPAFSGAFASANSLAYMQIPVTYVTYSGAATGLRYSAGSYSVINTSGSSSTSFFPGSSAGTLSNALYI